MARVITRFALFPQRIEGKWIWLKRYRVHQCWHYRGWDADFFEWIDYKYELL